MSFLQPLLLFGLPLIALPIIIHLIHQRRHRIIEWGAMIFLVEAEKISKGWIKLRNFLILLMRTLAVAGLIVAVSRPIAGGWLGLAAGGRPDTTILIIDRSATMQERSVETETSKLALGLDKLVASLETVDSGRWVVIESSRNVAQEIPRPRDLLELPAATPTDAAADIPAMLQTALEYVETNQTGRAEVWICSDSRSNDWDAGSGRWRAIRELVSGLSQGLRVYLLNFSERVPGNLGIRVTNVERRLVGGRVELDLDLHLTSSEELTEATEVPVDIVIAGARSVVPVEISGREATIEGHRITLDESTRLGWGRVEIRADSNPADNVFFFVFGEEPARRTAVVAEDDDVALILRIISEAPLDPAITYETKVMSPSRIGELEWQELGLLVWQAPIPEGPLAADIELFLDRGGRVLFLPPEKPTEARFAGIGWSRWREFSEVSPQTVTTWSVRDGLLAHDRSGKSLPVGELRLREQCTPDGVGVVQARCADGTPFLMRSDEREAYFLGSLPRSRSSDLATNGVVLFALVHRALDAGTEPLRPGLQGDASRGTDLESWNRVASVAGTPLSIETGVHAGVFATATRLLALNRPEAEDRSTVLPRDTVDGLFEGLDFVRLEERVGSSNPLLDEIWRLFLVSMIVALVAEALLCLPGRSGGRA